MNSLQTQFLDLASTIAQKVGQIQKQKINDSHDIEYKSEINFVTEVDKLSEKMIVDEITKHFPDHDILAEEGNGTRKDSPYKWIIDPLDGTTNYAHRIPHFCVSIALEERGQIVGGVVYQPILNELYTAYKGAGAFLNGQAIHVTKHQPLRRALVGTGFAYNLASTPQNNLNHFNKFIFKVQGMRRSGSAALDLCYVACGRYDAYWELNLYPWDTAAGLIMVTEAGGTISKINGSPYTVYEKDVLASNCVLHNELVSGFADGTFVQIP